MKSEKMVDTKFIDIEAKSLYNVIETFEKKVVNLSFINEEVLEKLNEKDLGIMPEEFLLYFKDIIKLNKLYEHTQVFKSEDEDLEGDENMIQNESFCIYNEHQDLIEKIKRYCFILCKIFKKNNNLFQILHSLNDKENHDFFKFLHVIKDLKEIFLIKFQTTAEEKFMSIRNLEELKEEEKNIQDEEKKLNDELEKIRKESYNELKELELILINKEKELDELKKSSEENIKKLLNRIPVNNIPEDLENINSLFEKTKNVYENQIKTYQDLEVSLVKKNKLLDLDIQNYINSIDAEIEDMDREIERWENELKKNKVSEHDLDAVLKRKEAEEQEKQFLKELTEKRSRIIKKKEDENNDAATIIQSYIRAVKERNLFIEHEKKKKKRKKKK
ncbi:pre-mRNA splicing factor, putative [Plasmodium ovale wallikeri]|uniref:Dynein regulatory complex protein 10 n=1 Tax=Plasmodium ovale wallikeri TaxID=864142 RepID=A0A1A8YUT3_PLAOA|nr:pre-mRNA splicing factor, putative [Plasmodium ovale wallikeri]SBT35387.1 pre-mRNA splicing factor, putative [Plasmodium ovale wallikeri]